MLPTGPINFNLTVNDIATSLQLLIILSLISISPFLLVMLTAFTRISIVLSVLRRALGLQTTPSNQILIGISLILTFFVMRTTFINIYQKAIIPWNQKKINFIKVLDISRHEIKKFMFYQTRKETLALFYKLDGQKKYPKIKNFEDVPMTLLMPAFIISELKTAFEISVVIFIPFIVIDMVVASLLMAMGMMMLPPNMISLPLKLLLFVLVNGWELLTKSLVQTFVVR